MIPKLVRTFLSTLLVLVVLLRAVGEPDGEIDDTACAALGTRIENLFNAHDVAGVLEVFDATALAERALRGLELDEGRMRWLARDYGNAMRTQVGFILSRFSEARVLRCERPAGEPRVLIRLLTPEGDFQYLAFVPGKDWNGRLRWVDAYLCGDGELLSASIRRRVEPVLNPGEQSAWSRLLGREREWEKTGPVVERAEACLRSGAAAEAWMIIGELPPTARENRDVILLRMAIARRLGLSSRLAVLAEWERCFPGDPAADLAGVGIDLERADHESVLRRLARLDAVVGGDPYLGCVRANVLNTAGRADEARVAAREALRQDPKLAAAYDALLRIELTAQDFRAVAALCDEMEQTFPDREVTSELLQKPAFRPFADSAEYRLRQEKKAAAAQALQPTRAECEALGQSLARAITTRRAAEVDALCDRGALCDCATKGLAIPAAVYRDFRSGFVAVEGRLGESLCATYGEASFLRVQEDQPEKRVLLRLRGGPFGVAYLAFACTRRSTGAPGWGELANYATGETLAETVRRSAVAFLAAHLQEFRDSLGAGDRRLLDAAPVIAKATQLIEAGNCGEALRLLRALPEQSRAERAILALMFNAASRLDSGDYQQVLEEWSFHHPGDPLLDLVRFEEEIRRGDYYEAIGHIDAFAEVIGGDPYLACRKAYAQLMDDDPTAARETIGGVLSAEPGLDIAYAVLLLLEVRAGDHEAAVRVLGQYAARFPSDDLLARIPLDGQVQKFLQSREFREWYAAESVLRQTRPD